MNHIHKYKIEDHGRLKARGVCLCGRVRRFKNWYSSADSWRVAKVPRSYRKELDRMMNERIAAAVTEAKV